MGRRAEPRANYRKDAITLHRMLSAIEVDEVSGAEWKTSVYQHLEAAMKLMLEHKPALAPVATQGSKPVARKAG